MNWIFYYRRQSSNAFACSLLCGILNTGLKFVLEGIMKDLNKNRPSVAKDVEAVITSFNQGSMILEAVRSLCEQTLLPERILLVDDG